MDGRPGDRLMPDCAEIASATVQEQVD